MEVTYLGHYGTDLTVVNAARVSFGKRTQEFRPGKDDRLLAFLARHKHELPFAHPHVGFHFKAPIFVARQLAKHQVGFVWSEISRRYVKDRPEFYIPSYWRKAAENVKQGSSLEPVDISPRGKCNRCGIPVSYPKRLWCSSECQTLSWRENNRYAYIFSKWGAAAKFENIPFTITPDDLAWPDKCPYLDIQLDYTPGDKNDNKASLDKIVPALGYVPGNVQIVSLLANKMKSSASLEQIKTFAKNALFIHGGVFAETSHSYADYCEKAADLYVELISQGVCAEQARMVLPQAQLTEWHWTGSLLGWSRVWNLRVKPDAQAETREIVQLIGPTMKALFPFSWAALTADR